MKAIQVTIVLIIVTVFYTAAQNTLAIPHMAEPTLFNGQIPSLATSHHASQRSANVSIVVDFDSSESFHTHQVGGTYNNYKWRLNRHIPDDSLHNYDFRWTAMRVDTLVDRNTNLGYSIGTTPMQIDSIAVPYNYTRQTAGAVVDSLVIRIYQTNAAGTITLSPNNVTGFPSNTVLWSQVIPLTSADTTGTNIGIKAVYPNYSLPAGQHFAIGVDFLGDTTNYFSVLAGGGDTCGNTCGSFPSQYKDNAQYSCILWFGGISESFALPLGIVYFDCNGSGSFNANACEAFYIQNFMYDVYMTVIPLLGAFPTASATNVCPGESVQLSANALSGTPPYSYHWSGIGLNDSTINSPTVTIPSTSLTGTYTYMLTVIDANNDSTVDSTSLFVRGIAINAGNDTTFACGAGPITLTPTITGSYGTGTSIAWMGPGGPVSTTSYHNADVGTYTVNITNPYGCMANDTVVVSSASTQRLGFVLETQYYGSLDTLVWEPCANLPITCWNTSVDTTAASGWVWRWNYQHGNQNTIATNLNTALAAIGSDTIVLIGDSATCQITYSRPIVVINDTAPWCLPITLSAIVNGNNVVCPGQSIQLNVIASGGSTPYTYSWTPSSSLSCDTCNNPIATPSVGTVYTVFVQDALGDTVSKQVSIAVVQQCDSVWPGDANDDGVADANDLLPIGTAFGSTGPVRANASNVWVAQYCNNWGGATNGINDKYIDCDGNGIVDGNDTIPISLNYGQTHQKTVEARSLPGAPPLFMQITNAPVAAGNIAKYNIVLGDTTTPANNVYGIAFTLQFDNTLVDASTLQQHFIDSWLGGVNTNLLTLGRSFPSQGYVDLAVTRIDHNNVSGSGAIGQLSVITIDNISGKDSITKPLIFNVVNVRAISANGDDVPIDGKADTVITYTGNEPSPVMQPNIEVYPNPTTGMVYITANGDISTIRVLGITGNELVKREAINTRQTTIDLSGLARGVYLLETTCGNQRTMKRVVLIR